MMMTEKEQELLTSFVGAKSEYYLKQWKRIRSSKNIISWNWAAFFFHIFWFSYRKMYYYVYWLIGLVCFRYYFVMKFDLPKVVDYALKYLIWIVIGLLANYLYLKHAEKKMKEKVADSTNKYELKDSLERIGGVSPNSAIITVIIFIMLFMLPVIIGILGDS